MNTALDGSIEKKFVLKCSDSLLFVDITADLEKVQGKLRQSHQEITAYKESAQLFCDELSELEKRVVDMQAKVRT